VKLTTTERPEITCAAFVESVGVPGNGQVWASDVALRVINAVPMAPRRSPPPSLRRPALLTVSLRGAADTA